LSFGLFQPLAAFALEYKSNLVTKRNLWRVSEHTEIQPRVDIFGGRTIKNGVIRPKDSPHIKEYTLRRVLRRLLSFRQPYGNFGGRSGVRAREQAHLKRMLRTPRRGRLHYMDDQGDTYGRPRHIEGEMLRDERKCLRVARMILNANAKKRSTILRVRR